MSAAQGSDSWKSLIPMKSRSFLPSHHLILTFSVTSVDSAMCALGRLRPLNDILAERPHSRAKWMFKRRRFSDFDSPLTAKSGHTRVTEQ